MKEKKKERTKEKNENNTGITPEEQTTQKDNIKQTRNFSSHASPDNNSFVLASKA